MFDKAVLRLPGMRAMLMLACALSFARALAVVGQAFGLAGVIVGVWEGRPLGEQAASIALFLACFVGRQVVLTVQSALLDRYAHARAEELREELLLLVFRQGPALVQQHGSASVVSTVIQGVEDVRVYIGLIVPKMAAVAVVPFALLCAMFPLDWVSGLIALVCFPFIILYMVMIGHTAKDDAATRHGEFQQMANHFIDAMAGMDTLRAFGRSASYGGAIYRASERFRELTMKTLRIATLSSAVLDVFATLALAGVAVMLGFRLVEGSIAFFPALAVLILVPEYFRPIREFAADYHASLDGRSAFAALRALREQAAKREAAHEPYRANAGESANAGGRAAAEVLAPLPAGAPADAEALAPSLTPSLAGEQAGAPAGAAPRLALRGVGYSYPDHPSALADVSFQVSGPCKVGVIGASGSGKSTLMSLLGGFSAPDAGEMELDGRAVSSLRTAAWQSRATFIPQDPYLFHATLRDNVAFYLPDATDEQVSRAVELAGLAPLVAELPHGLDTLIGQGGRVLSGGQAHRVALARAFLDERRTVLLFDEPTAHLDIETERELKERMLPLMEGKLVFFATHRLHWVENMDYVLEMADGRVVWQGTPAQWRACRAEAKGGAR